MSTATDELATETGQTAAIDATTGTVDRKSQLKAEMEKLGCPCKDEHNAIFDAACRFLDAAAIANDPSLQAAKETLQQLAYDPAHPVDEAFRMALLNSITNLNARLEVEQRTKTEETVRIALTTTPAAQTGFTTPAQNEATQTQQLMDTAVQAQAAATGTPSTGTGNEAGVVGPTTEKEQARRENAAAVTQRG